MDWNNDGDIDIIVGDRNGFINFFERNTDGTLQAGVKLQSGGTDIDAGGNSAPDFADWDNDGDLDMIVGSDATSPVRVYENTGSASAYQFDGYTEFTGGGSVVTLYRSMPSIYDMNGDGLFDVVIGATDKKFHYYENTGSAASPSFAADAPLEYQAGGLILTDHSDSRLDICDWNEDGHLDLVTGDYDDYVYLFFAYDEVGIGETTTAVVAPSALRINENPVRSNLSISINLAAPATAELTVYTMDGRVASTHTTGSLAAGHNTVNVPNDLPNGTYVLHCTAGNRELTERFVVVR